MLLAIALQAKADLSDYTETRPLLYGMDLDYPPLEFINESGKPDGLDIEFTKCLMARLKLPFTYSPNTWENVCDDVLSGKVDLAMMVYSPYRTNITNYSRAVFRLYYQIVFRKDAKESFDVRHLAGKSVAYMASRPIKDTLTKVGAVLHEIKDLAIATKQLSAGKYDAVICFRYQSKYIIDKYQLRNLDTEDLTLTPREYCYVSNDKQLIEAINVQLQKMEEEGIINEVYGDVTSSFGSFVIPYWVWYLITLLVIMGLLAFIVFQRRYQKKLRSEMERVQRSEQMKTVFLGNISHALRTPLNAIIGFSDVLNTEELNVMSVEDQHQLLQLINTNGKQLLYFINQLLELSKIESDNEAIEHTEVYLPDVMNAYMDELRKDAALGVCLRVEGDDITALINENYMRIVTKHFLSNALRHTKKGSVTLRYNTESNGLHIEVQDTGDGLPEALKDNLFNLLSEKATFIQDNIPGLGLTICKAIVDRCKGKIGAFSPEEGGTVLWIWVPVKIIKKH
jgi:signal transduction histidine kinase